MKRGFERELCDDYPSYKRGLLWQVEDKKRNKRRCDNVYFILPMFASDVFMSCA